MEMLDGSLGRMVDGYLISEIRDREVPPFAKPSEGWGTLKVRWGRRWKGNPRAQVQQRHLGTREEVAASSGARAGGDERSGDTAIGELLARVGASGRKGDDASRRGWRRIARRLGSRDWLDEAKGWALPFPVGLTKRADMAEAALLAVDPLKEDDEQEVASEDAERQE
jgi:hypothetical protein